MKAYRELHYVSHAALPSAEANSVQVVKMCAAFAPFFERVTLHGRETELPAEATWEHYDVPPAFTLRRLRNRRVKLVSRALYSLRLVRRLEGARGLLYGRDYHTLALSVLTGTPRLPLALEVHQPPGNRLEAWLLGRILRSPRLVGLVVISEALGEEYLRRYGRHLEPLLTVAPDGADLPAERPAPPRPHDGPPRIGYVGNLYPGKGMERIAELSERLPGYEFQVVGGKPADVERWRQAIPGTNVRFHGYRPHGEAQRLMRDFDVVVAPYRRAVLIGGDDTDIGRWMSPLKIFEYMGALRPMVVSDLPVIREVLEHDRNALLADADDLEDWVACLERLVNDPATGTRLAEAAWDDLAARYRWSRRAEGIVAALERSAGS